MQTAQVVFFPQVKSLIFQLSAPLFKIKNSYIKHDKMQIYTG